MALRDFLKYLGFTAPQPPTTCVTKVNIIWYQKYNSWFADLPGEDNKALVSTGANGKWHFAFNIGEKVWCSDPILQPMESADTAKMMCEGIYKRVYKI